MIIHELSWLSTLLGIALLCAFVALLICKIIYKQASMKVLIIIGVIVFILGIIGVFIYASQAMPL
ncbi:hypothetical protein [uncultured Catenibacterium sp.]|uniref:hypothetical protein n=1 Tax=uncultured Catenibacterium sp. TaxID=286142 RepID=UPI0025949D81|nr:hypothetical protein [uncultured Catenibacterium sp.]